MSSRSAMEDDANDDANAATARKPTSVQAARPVTPRWSRRAGLALICCYIAWAFIIPIKNVLMIKNPALRIDSTITNQTKYVFDASVTATSIDTVIGTEIEPLLRRVVAIVMGSRTIRDMLESRGAFEVDLIHQFLSPSEYQDIALYYALLYQAIEFPGGVFTPRPRVFASTSSEVAADALGLWVLPTDGSDPRLISISCAIEHATMEGARCFQNDTSYVCIDFAVKGETRRYENVKLDQSRVNSGLSNNIGLLYVIETFHVVMAKLFLTKSWNKTLDSVQFASDPADEEMALNSGFASVFRDGIPVVREKFVMSSYILQLSELTTSTVESCYNSEIIANLAYTRAYVLDLVLSALMELETLPYGIDSSTALTIPRDRVAAIVAPLSTFNITLTSGARPNTKVTKGGTTVLNGLYLTTITRAVMRFKTDTRLTSTDTFGSSMRMLIYMAMYPEYYSTYAKTVGRDAAVSQPYDVMQFSLIGGAMSGMNTFKQDWYGNTQGVFKLAEIPRATNGTRLDVWWDEEANIAAWFQALESSNEAPFYAFDDFVDIEATGVALDDNPVTRCHRAFFKTLVKIVWLSLLSASDLSTYLNFMSNVNGGARTWFVSAIKRDQLVGEQSNGQRFGFMYSSNGNNRRDDGSAWVIVPLLDAMLEHHGREATLAMILAEYNASFPLFVTTEYGLIHFTDSAQCKVGFQKLNVSAETNNMEKITAKFFPAVQQFVTRMVDSHSVLAAKMSTALATNGTLLVKIPKEMLVGSPSSPKKAGFIGSPVYWEMTSLAVGLLKLWPATTPPADAIQLYRSATVCYRTLELRYLNESVRCWVEPGSTTRVRASFNSEGLRYIIWSNWSISWVLNAIAVFIAIQFLWRFVRAYKLTQFRCISLWSAAQYNFQSVGVLSYAQVVLMTISAVPLLAAFHLPSDPDFITQTSATVYPKFMREILVTLSATWFVRLGFDTVNQLMELHDVQTRVNTFHLRAASQVLILIVRLATPDKLSDADYEVWKLITTVWASIMLGVLCALVPFYLHRRARKITPRHTPAAVKGPSPLFSKGQNLVIQRLKQEGMPLNRHGLLGFTRYYGWAVSGLILEGWEVYERKQKSQVVLTRGVCQIVLQVDDQGQIQCLL